MSVFDPVRGPCACCGRRPATVWWTGSEGVVAAVHGGAAPWCMVCALKARLRFAREVSASIPRLEAELARLEAN